jgi:uroporphyrinogen-III decarboxylase
MYISDFYISIIQLHHRIRQLYQQCADRISQRCGSGPLLHICGDTMNILDNMVNIGATVLSLDNQIDLAEAKNKVGHKICLAGNVKPYTLWRGTPRKSRMKSKNVCKKPIIAPTDLCYQAAADYRLARQQQVSLL